jgi:hypothetical protein
VGDAESLARLPDGGWLVGFERLHRIWSYRRLDGPAVPVEAPPGLDDSPYNGGLEALAVLADGRWLAVTERLVAPGGTYRDRTGWIGGPGRWARLTYRAQPGFDPSDACAVPAGAGAGATAGGALVLERHFSWTEGLSAVISHVAPLAAGLVEGSILARLAPPLPNDNWEGITAFRHRGRLLVAVLSDDNENPLQRALLSVFVWPGA